jgi:hypothetical protein
MIELADLKEYLKIADNTQDVFLMKCIDFTTERMSAMCGRDLRYGAKYDVIDGREQVLFKLNVFPMEKIIHIHYRDNSSGSVNKRELFDKDLFNGQPPEENLYLNNERGDVYLLNGIFLPSGIKNIQIKYYAGYTVNAPEEINETPLDLKSVCLTACAEYYLKSMQGEGRLGLSARHRTENGISYQENFKDEDYSSILKRYKDMRV